MVFHKVWGTAEAHSLPANCRSWESMLAAFQELMPVPVSVMATDAPTAAVLGGSPATSPTIMATAQTTQFGSSTH